tara:strand:+ start:907 stop:1239 length:333 start_codon:yes stop_codon:yes gene_type:complete
MVYGDPDQTIKIGSVGRIADIVDELEKIEVEINSEKVTKARKNVLNSQLETYKTEIQGIVDQLEPEQVTQFPGEAIKGFKIRKKKLGNLQKDAQTVLSRITTDISNLAKI